jgi:hypothetical protein
VTATKDPAGVEHFDHLGKVGKRAGQPVDLIYHHHIDQALADICQYALQARTLHGGAR